MYKLVNYCEIRYFIFLFDLFMFYKELFVIFMLSGRYLVLMRYLLIYFDDYVSVVNSEWNLVYKGIIIFMVLREMVVFYWYVCIYVSLY